MELVEMLAPAAVAEARAFVNPCVRQTAARAPVRTQQRLPGSATLQSCALPLAAATLFSASRRRKTRLAARQVSQAAPAGSAAAWRERHWFPIASTLELDPQRPTPVRLDGLDLVVWKVPGKTEEDGWQVMADACAHRLAPLSEGRIEPKTGCLQCAYHGWEFNSQGNCQRIPQVEEAAAQKMRESPCSQVPSFPTRLALKMVWVWLGEGGPKGHPLDVVQGTHLESEFEIVGTYTRDLPYGYDSLVENLIDVSHVPFAHHGLQGTRDDAAPVSMTIPEMKGSDQQGDLLNFTFWDRTMRMRREAQFFLRSPFFFFYLGEFLGDKDNEEYKQFTARRGADPDGKPRFRLNCACVPVAPGWSRLILCDASVPGTGGVRSVLERLGQIPPWVIHLLSNRFLDSDLAFLHHQERKLRQGPDGCTAWNKAYYMPGEADRSISAWRQWLSKEGARCVDPKVKLPASPLSREHLLNRWEQHSASCKHCRQAMENLELAQTGLCGLFLLALGAGQLQLTALCLPAELVAAAGVGGIELLKQELRLRQAMTEFSSNLPTIWAAAHQGPPSSHKLDYPRRQAECAATRLATPGPAAFRDRGGAVYAATLRAPLEN